jgi:hypothetical protein
MNNDLMEIQGRVHNGVVILDGDPVLPEGAAVTVSYPVRLERNPPAEKRRIQVPLVRCDQPGSVHLSGERIAEILDEQDASLHYSFLNRGRSRGDQRQAARQRDIGQGIVRLCEPHRAEHMKETKMTRPTITKPGEGRTIAVVGDVYRFLATGKDTNGKYADFGRAGWFGKDVL